MTEHKDIYKHLEQLPEALADAVQGLSDQQLDTPLGEGKWTIRQIVHHISDTNINAYTGAKQIATEDQPVLKSYNQEQWATLADYKMGGIEPTLTLVKGLHERWIQFLKSLPEASWSREAVHQGNGKVTLHDMLRAYSHHNEEHLQDIIIFRMKKNW